MTLKLIQAASAEPLTVVEAKQHLRVEHSVDDALIGSLITVARQRCEHETRRALVNQVWERVLDGFPQVELLLGRPPVRQVLSLTYVDAAGATQTMAPTAYVLDSDAEEGWVLPAADTEWPETADTVNAVRVRFEAGYGDTGAAVPTALRQWMLLQVGALYAFRESIAAGAAIHELPGRFVDALLDPFRIYL